MAGNEREAERRAHGSGGPRGGLQSEGGEGTGEETSVDLRQLFRKIFWQCASCGVTSISDCLVNSIINGRQMP
jgi:hypothetical protein